MNIKYFFEYKDVDGNDYRCEILQESYNGQPIQINGSCVIDYPKIDNIYTVIRGSGMRLNLEANQNLTLEDLYSENQNEYFVVLIRNGFTLFVGVINPEGLYEDLVNKEWQLSIDCSDGLANLQDLSYVDEDGFPYLGKSSDIDIINNCLKRIGLPYNTIIESSISTRYDGLSSSECPLANTYSNNERFYKDDGETIMSCKEVLESVLRKYGGVICKDRGKYAVFSFYEFLTDTKKYFRYYNGDPLGSYTGDYGTVNIGFYDEGADNYWVNANQRKEIVPALGAVRVNYKYGFVKSIIDNPNFRKEGGSVFGWSVNPVTGGTYPAVGYGFEVAIYNGLDYAIESIGYSVVAGDSFVLRYNVTSKPNASYPLDVRVGLRLEGASNTYYLQLDGSWGATEVKIIKGLVNPGVQETFLGEITTEPIPESGNIIYVIYKSARDTFVPDPIPIEDEGTLLVNSISLSQSDSNSLDGENHTQQVEGRNKKVEEVIEVSVGDNASDVYLGALYEDDKLTNTEFWHTVYNQNEQKPILQILSEYISRYRKTILYKLSGDVGGYFDYLNKFTSPLIPNKVFMITSYSFDTKNNTCDCEFIELNQSEFEGNTYEFTLDYGNVTKPTIIG